MRFLQSDLRRNDRAGIRRWNAPVTSSVLHFFFTHHQNPSAQLSGISAIVPPAYRPSMLTMIRARPQYIAFVHGKESHYEQYRPSV
jgi:hypothetical protein